MRTQRLIVMLVTLSPLAGEPSRSPRPAAAARSG